MYVIHIKLTNGERLMEYANDMHEAATKADAYSGRFAKMEILPIRLKDMRQGKEASKPKEGDRC